MPVMWYWQERFLPHLLSDGTGYAARRGGLEGLTRKPSREGGLAALESAVFVFYHTVFDISSKQGSKQASFCCDQGKKSSL